MGGAVGATAIVSLGKAVASEAAAARVCVGVEAARVGVGEAATGLGAVAAMAVMAQAVEGAERHKAFVGRSRHSRCQQRNSTPVMTWPSVGACRPGSSHCTHSSGGTHLRESSTCSCT